MRRTELGGASDEVKTGRTHAWWIIQLVDENIQHSHDDKRAFG